MNPRARKLTWSKEVERRVRDLYRRVYPDAQRAKFAGREDREGHPDIVGVPFHVQVKARSHTWVTKEWEAAQMANFTGGPTHLVVQDFGKQPLLVMKLETWIEEQQRVQDAGRSGLQSSQEVGPQEPDHRGADRAVHASGDGLGRGDSRPIAESDNGGFQGDVDPAHGRVPRGV